MKAAAANLDFERAAALRDRVRSLKTRELGSARRALAAACPSMRLNDWRRVFEVQEYVRLCGAAIRGTVSRPFYRHDIVEQFEAIGIGSLTVVLLTGFFTGAVLALNSGITLDQFGAREFVGRLISASMVKELGPVLTGLMLAGRVGSGIAAELGSMVVTDQINALRALGTDPVRKLVVPRLLAGLLHDAGADRHRRRRRHRRRVDHRGDAAAGGLELYWTLDHRGPVHGGCLDGADQAVLSRAS